jgi:3'-phosphoadenosine 5'-phosphosulfate sulfotransferase (PAPS reductase)/FAD synthetase
MTTSTTLPTTLDEKIAHGESVLRRVVEEYVHPVVMSSFGKDSMVVLDLVQRMGLRFPLVFHREPFFQKKFEFANRIIAENDYQVYDYPPLTTAVTQRDEHIEIVNEYQAGDSFVYLPTGIREPEPGVPYLCGMFDIYSKPLGTFAYPWDVAVLGHKSSDVDPILGPCPLRVDVRHNENAPDGAFPLRYFTDADVWEYTERFHVPFNEKRYDAAHGYQEFRDVTYNNDYFHACTLCIDRTQPETVFCPKAQQERPNLSAQIRFIEPSLPDYVGGA